MPTLYITKLFGRICSFVAGDVYSMYTTHAMYDYEYICANAIIRRTILKKFPVQ